MHWLNAYHEWDGLLLRFIAPAVRCLVHREPSPSWLLRHLHRIERQRGRDGAMPFGGDEPNLDFGLDYGWELLQNWTLDVYLRLGNEHRSAHRLDELVRFIAQRARHLASGTIQERLLLPDLEDLCIPLRRVLYWYAASPRSEPRERRVGRDLLKTLMASFVPRVPPRKPVALDDGHLEHYKELLSQVKPVWRSVIHADTEEEQRTILVAAVDRLRELQLSVEHDRDPYKSRARHLLGAVWRTCGDLSSVTPAHVARSVLKHLDRIQLAPDAIKKALRAAEEDLNERWTEKEAWMDLRMTSWRRGLSFDAE